MKNIFLIAVLVVAGTVLIPWSRFNWGKFSLIPAEAVTVSGQAKTITKNQIASFNAGVDAVNNNKDEAIKEVNTKVAALIEAVKKFGIKAEDIKTQNVSVYQNEEAYYDNGVQKMRKGQWRVSNSVEITLRNIDQASDLTKILTDSGATNVYGPNFRMDDTNDAEKGLFDEAMKDAREKAQIIAKASGRSLGKVMTVTEGGTTNNVYPMALKADGMGGGGAPIEPGSATVSKSITVTFELK